MGSNTWANQWGEGGFGHNEDDEKSNFSKNRLGGSGGGNKMEEVKAAASTGISKAKTAAVVGAQKVKSGTSTGIKWIKNQYKKKPTS